MILPACGLLFVISAQHTGGDSGRVQADHGEHAAAGGQYDGHPHLHLRPAALPARHHQVRAAARQAGEDRQQVKAYRVITSKGLQSTIVVFFKI